MQMTKKQGRHGRRGVASSLAALLLIAAACSDDGESAALPEPGSADISEPTTTSTAAERVDEPNEASDQLADLELVELEVESGDVTNYVSSAMGGVRFQVLDGYVPLVAGDQIILTTEAMMSAGPGFAHAAVGVQSVLGQTARLETTDQYLGAIRGADVDVVPTGTKLELFGYDLAGYEITGGDANLFLFGAERFGAPSQSMFGPLGVGLEYLGDTPSGVLKVGVSGPDSSALDLLPALGHLVSTMELTGPGLDAGLPDGQFLEAENPGEPPAPIAPSGDLPPLGQPFSPIEPGRYELVNFGLPLSVDIPEGWWAQPNFPGVIVLTAAGSAGPGDRDIVFINDITALMPIAGGPIPAGEPEPIDDLDALLANPPGGLEFSDEQRFELGVGESVTPVVSVVVSVDESATCTLEDPCDYALVTSYGFVKQLISTLEQRVWFFPDHPTGLAAAVAQDPTRGGWIDEARAVMTSMEMASQG